MATRDLNIGKMAYYVVSAHAGKEKESNGGRKAKSVKAVLTENSIVELNSIRYYATAWIAFPRKA
jgi:hypothetical protein